MYKAFYGLRVEPFGVSPDPGFLYQTPAVREALASFSYALYNRKGIVLLTGEVGTGKTTIVNKLMQWLQRMHYASALIFNARLSVPDFFDVMMADFGITCESRDKGQRLIKLNEWLLQLAHKGQTAVVIVDEAQGLSSELLEELRLLTNLETNTHKLLQIVLSGQPELDAKLREPQLRQLRQRIMVRCTTRPLSAEETHAYVNERLRRAGSNGAPIFSEEALQAAWRYSAGIPRNINLLCEHALINAFADQQRSVAEETVRMVAQEFGLDEATGGAANPAAENRPTPVARVGPASAKLFPADKPAGLAAVADPRKI
jgi:type II secretory pathway predicted ATPase ExeA